MGHSYDEIYLHFVFSTKNRAHFITEDVRAPLYNYIAGIARNKQCRLIIAGGMPDHVHLLVRATRKIAPMQLVNAIKANSTTAMRAVPSMAAFAWQTGYAVFSVGCRERDRIVRYIQNQQAHHATMTVEQELARIAADYGMG